MAFTHQIANTCVHTIDCGWWQIVWTNRRAIWCHRALFYRFSLTHTSALHRERRRLFSSSLTPFILHFRGEKIFKYFFAFHHHSIKFFLLLKKKCKFRNYRKSETFFDSWNFELCKQKYPEIESSINSYNPTITAQWKRKIEKRVGGFETILIVQSSRFQLIYCGCRWITLNIYGML